MPNKKAVVLKNALKGLAKPGAAIKPKDPVLPASDAKTLTPKYLLGHQNHFDSNVYTPEGVLRTKTGMVSPDTTKTTT